MESAKRRSIGGWGLLALGAILVAGITGCNQASSPSGGSTAATGADAANAASQQPTQVAQEPEGPLAPAFSLKDTEGNTVSLEGLKGKGPILINFFSPT